MTRLARATSYAEDNEKAMGIAEVEKMHPDNHGFHRFQIIYVIRDGKIAEFTKDLGMAKDYSWTNPFTIYSFMEYSVGELMGMAEQVRNTPPYDKADLAGVSRCRT